MSRWLIALAMAALLPATSARAEIATPDQVLALPAELRARVHDEVLDDRSGHQRRLEKLVAFMFSDEGLAMSYQESATSTVAETYQTRTANCLSFTMLFLALAREAQLDAFPQEIEQTLSWRRDDNTLYLSNHVNAGVRIGGRVFIVDVAGDNVIARDPPEQISQRRLIAHYYNNLAVASLERADYVTALALIDRSLELDPSYASHWSNAGVLHMRNGEPREGEQAYRRALALDPRNASALFNLSSFAQRTGDRVRELELRKRLADVQRSDPFHHFLLAANYERAGDYPRAIRHYRRAIQLHPDEHRFYSALANVYVTSGDLRRAVRALTRAQALSDGDVRAAYRTQLDRLKATR